MIRIAREYETELGIKVILATVIGMFLSDFLGFRNSLTITFTMVLVTYVNRGFYGAANYYRLRMQHQTLLVLLMYILVVTLQNHTPLPGWVIVLITTVPVAALFLYLFFAHQFTPMNLSPVISPLMLMNTALGDPTFYSRRIMFTFIAIILGWIVAMIYPFRSKVGRTVASMDHMADYLCGQLEKAASGAGFDKDYSQKAAEITFEISEIAAYLNVVYQDVKTPKYSCFKAQIPEIKAKQASLNALFELANKVAAGSAALSADEDFRSEFYRETEEVCAAHRKALAKEAGAAFGDSRLDGSSTAELGLASSLIRYKRSVGTLAAACAAA